MGVYDFFLSFDYFCSFLLKLKELLFSFNLIFYKILLLFNSHSLFHVLKIILLLFFLFSVRFFITIVSRGLLLIFKLFLWHEYIFLVYLIVISRLEWWFLGFRRLFLKISKVIVPLVFQFFIFYLSIYLIELFLFLFIGNKFLRSSFWSIFFLYLSIFQVLCYCI